MWKGLNKIIRIIYIFLIESDIILSLILHVLTELIKIYAVFNILGSSYVM